MKVCHTISSIDAKSGGTSTYMQLVANAISESLDLSLVYIHSADQLVLSNKVAIHDFGTSVPFFQSYSSQMNSFLKMHKFDLHHGNGLWMYPVHSMCKNARDNNIPYILSPHGMLEPWALNIGKWKKKIAAVLFQNRDLRLATCLHATAQMEAYNIRKHGFTNPIAIIPNGIDISGFPLKTANHKKTILFLSRVHPKKGLELLIEAWSKLGNATKYGWSIEIAGNGDENYIQELKKLIDSKNLQNEIHLIGPQYGDEKLATYHRADLFVLPTYSENFGIVVAEALACGIPVITTKGAPWEELQTSNAGWWIDISVDALVNVLEDALNMDKDSLHAMGRNGRTLVEQKYSIESVSEKMIELYNWVLGNIEKPEFVI